MQNRAMLDPGMLPYVTVKSGSSSCLATAFLAHWQLSHWSDVLTRWNRWIFFARWQRICRSHWHACCSRQGHWHMKIAVQKNWVVFPGQLLLMADADGATSIRDLERLERVLGPKDWDEAFVASDFHTFFYLFTFLRMDLFWRFGFIFFMFRSCSSFALRASVFHIEAFLWQDDSPQIAFGSRHHLREEALNKRPSWRNKSVARVDSRDLRRTCLR